MTGWLTSGFNRRTDGRLPLGKGLPLGERLTLVLLVLSAILTNFFLERLLMDEPAGIERFPIASITFALSARRVVATPPRSRRGVVNRKGDRSAHPISNGRAQETWHDS